MPWPVRRYMECWTCGGPHLQSSCQDYTNDLDASTATSSVDEYKYKPDDIVDRRPLQKDKESWEWSLASWLADSQTGSETRWTNEQTGWKTWWSSTAWNEHKPDDFDSKRPLQNKMWSDIDKGVRGLQMAKKDPPPKHDDFVDPSPNENDMASSIQGEGPPDAKKTRPQRTKTLLTQGFTRTKRRAPC